jgi:hypothetical protein
MHVNFVFASFGSGWRITFDPTILQASSVTPGGAPYTTVVTNTFDNTAGTVDYAATGATVVNADFVVATITFDVMGEGTSALMFTPPFVVQYIPGFGPFGINGTSVNGSITGVASGPTIVTIDIKPGSDPNAINPKSKGKIPVAILSTPDFDATTEVDKSSLTFGRTGNESSLFKCTGDEDANGDGKLDVVCHFNTPQTGFQSGDTVGVLKGTTIGGVPIVGTDSVKIVPK